MKVTHLKIIVPEDLIYDIVSGGVACAQLSDFQKRPTERPELSTREYRPNLTREGYFYSFVNRVDYWLGGKPLRIFTCRNPLCSCSRFFKEQQIMNFLLQ